LLFTSGNQNLYLLKHQNFRLRRAVPLVYPYLCTPKMSKNRLRRACPLSVFSSKSVSVPCPLSVFGSKPAPYPVPFQNPSVPLLSVPLKYTFSVPLAQNRLRTLSPVRFLAEFGPYPYLLVPLTVLDLQKISLRTPPNRYPSLPYPFCLYP